jgi:hypothetical protein
MRRHHPALLLLVGALAGAACNDSKSPNALVPTAPTPPAVSAPAPPASGIAVSGKVYDTGNRVISGATVEVMNGPSAGLKVTSVFDGGFNIFGQFDADTQFRATKDGLEAGVKNLTPYCERCNPHHWIFFALGLPVAPANIAGDYTVTITADPSCATLPGHARQRTYSTTIVALPEQPTAANTRFRAIPSGANIVPNQAWEGLWLNVAGDYVEVVTGDLHGQPGIIEQTDVNAYFTVDGVAKRTPNSSGASTISLALEAQIAHCELKSGLQPLDANGWFNCPATRAVSSVVCQSSNHQLVLTRR